MTPPAQYAYTLRMTTPPKLKTCSACGLTKPLEAFGRNRQTPDGLAYYCKDCAAKKQAQWVERNPEKMRQAKAKYLARIRADNARRGDPYAAG